MMLGGVMVGLNISDRVKLKAAYNLFNTRFERFARDRLQHNDLLSQHQFNLGMEFYLENDFSAGFTGGFYAIEKTINQPPNFGTVLSGVEETDDTLFAVDKLPPVGPDFPEQAVYPRGTRDLFRVLRFRFSHQFQSKLQLVYYPLGNLNFYGITSGAILLDSDENRGKQTIFSQSVGVKLVGSMWLDGAVSVGNHLNYITDRSFVVYDTYDPVTFIRV